MTINNDISWTKQLKNEYDQAKKLEKSKVNTAIPLDKIVTGLFNAIKEKKIDKTNKKITKQVNFLVDEQLKYYNSSKFGFIEKFFSALRNFFTFGKFSSSAYLARQLLERLDAPKSSALKDKLIKDLKKIWSSDDTCTRLINDFWEVLLKEADLEKTLEKDNDNKFCITFSKPIKGKYKVINFTIHQSLKFTIREEETKKVIEFIGDNFDFSVFSATLNIKIKEMVVEKCSNADSGGCQLTFGIEGMSDLIKNRPIPAAKVQKFLNRIKW